MSSLCFVYFIDIDLDRKTSCQSNMPTNLFQQSLNIDISDIVCAHANDLNGNHYDKARTKYAEMNPGKLMIIYSGNGCETISEEDMKSKRVLTINRPVYDQESSINESEWNKIYDLTDLKNREFIFSILDDGFMAIAFFILCQAYLFVVLSTEKISLNTEKFLLDTNHIKDYLELMVDPNLINSLDWWEKTLQSQYLDKIKLSEILCEEHSKTCISTEKVANLYYAMSKYIEKQKTLLGHSFFNA